MTIQVGEKLPSVTFMHMSDAGPAPISTEELFGGKTVALFAVPGAFTPTCSNQHMPGYVQHAASIREKGVDTIVCVSVNDAFVMDAWGKNLNADKITMLSDGNCEFTESMGLIMDGSGFGLGKVSSRYAAIIEDGKINCLLAEKGGAFEVSSAENILEHL